MRIWYWIVQRPNFSLNSDLFFPQCKFVLNERQWCNSQIALKSQFNSRCRQIHSSSTTPFSCTPHPPLWLLQQWVKGQWLLRPSTRRNWLPPFSPLEGRSTATNTAPARKQIGCLMTAVIFETLSSRSATTHWLNLYGHQVAPRWAGSYFCPATGNWAEIRTGLSNHEQGEHLHRFLGFKLISVGCFLVPRCVCHWEKLVGGK